MKKQTLINLILAALFLLNSSSVWADLQTNLKEERALAKNAAHISSLKNQFSNTLSQRHVVYVAGFLNEVLPLQFIKNAEALKELGVAAITRIYPGSKYSTSESAEYISAKLIDLFNNGNENGEGKGLPILLIGHSKGAVEVVLTAINYPDLITKGIVEKVVSVQGAYSTPLAELAPAGEKICKPIISPCTFIRKVFTHGLESLREKNSSQVFSQALNNLGSTGSYARVSQAIFYIRSSQTVLGGTAPALVKSHIYLKLYNDNDGLVPIDKQKLNSIGNDLGIIDADHADLFIHSNPLVYQEVLLDFRRTQNIKSFTRALIRTLY